jgi:WD40 repeat protein
LGTFTAMDYRVIIQKTAALTGHSGSVYALAVSGASSFFSGSGDKIVAEWDLNNPGEGRLMAKIPEIIYSLFTDLENDRLLVGQATGGIHVISLSERNEIRLLQYHTAPVFHLDISKEHNLLFSLAGDGKLGVMNSHNLALKAVLTVGIGKLRTCSVNVAETLLAVGSADGSITVFSLPDLQPVKQWQAHQPGFSVNALTFSPDGTLLLSGSRDAHLNIFTVADDFHLQQSIPAHNYAIYSIVYSPDQKLLATGSRDKTIKIWDPKSFEVLHRIDNEKNEGHKNSVNKIMWHPGTGHLISASDDRAILVWDIQIKQP